MPAAVTIPEEQLARMVDVPVEIDLEMDRRILTMREILDLREGSLIGTTRSAGENIDIYIGGAPVGFGEVVALGSIIGVRLTDLKDEEYDLMQQMLAAVMVIAPLARPPPCLR